MKNLLKILVMIPCLIFLVNCSKSSKSNNANCYQQAGYGQTYYNPACNNVNGYPGNGTGQVCDGVYNGYIDRTSGQFVQGQFRCFAQTRNCAGYTVQTQYGQMVLCQ